MSSEELNSIFDRQAVVVRGMSHRENVDVPKIESFIKELEDYDGKKSLFDRCVIWYSIRTLKDIVKKNNADT